MFWILAAAAATGGVWELDDGTDATGTTRISGVAQAAGETFIDLTGAPLQFDVACFADIGGTNVTLTIGFTS